MNTLAWLLLALALLKPLAVTAHGEDKPGPNGGFIRMPGAFHTEVVAQKPNQLKVFLLDIAWKNPVVAKSSVKATHESSAKQKSDVSCSPEKNFFVCKFPKSVDVSKAGTLTLFATRDSQAGIPAAYPLPLKLDKPTDDHSGHH
ncbi:MAG: hypothetical protein U1E10_14840 [Bdellovibrionales bacterium]|nr:hypothetical protein [Bdellovibrionales bacterium]